MRLTKGSHAAAAFAVLTLAACADAPTGTSEQPAAAPPRFAASANPNAPVDVIVSFNDAETDPVGRARALAAQSNAEVRFTYQHSVKGFAARMPVQAAEALQRANGVRRVELDGVARMTGTVTARSWGQDRIDQRALPLNGSYTFTSTGAGVRAYILDTGILPTHQEFSSRLLPGFSAFGDNSTTDCQGHGTHVAGTVGGSTVGVAPQVSLVPVRVLDCTGYGSWSGIIAGIDWVASQKKNNPGVPMVANMSIGGSVSVSVNDAVTRAISAGVVFAVSAGNSNVDACQQSPASTPSALTVGATTSTDARASYSNFGSCVDLFAPGSSIYSAAFGGSSAYTTMSGTSMASPHVAGVAALILSAYPSYAPNQVRASMVEGATANVVTSAGTGSPNLLLSNLVGATSAPPPSDTTTVTPPPPPPPATIVLSVGRQVSKNSNTARLSWSGATTSNVEIFRNGIRVLTTANDGSHNDSRLARGTYTYRVCNTSSTTCSADVTVSF